jgi:hypothetical protein
MMILHAFNSVYDVVRLTAAYIWLNRLIVTAIKEHRSVQCKHVEADNLNVPDRFPRPRPKRHDLGGGAHIAFLRMLNSEQAYPKWVWLSWNRASRPEAHVHRATFQRREHSF